MAPITHIVLFRYRDSVSWKVLESHFHDFLALKDRCLRNGEPYMLSLKMGKNHSWENFHRNMTHGFILEFANRDDRDYYLINDKVHHAFSDKAKDLIEDSIVVDFEDGVLFGTNTKSLPESKSFHGQCHCGKVGWTVELDNYQHILCHCRTCQLLGGGPYSCNAVVDKSALKVVAGDLSTYSYQGASGKPVMCYYCSTCTSHAYHHQLSNPDKVIVRTLLLDGGDKMGVGAELFSEASFPWAKNLEKALPLR